MSIFIISKVLLGIFDHLKGFKSILIILAGFLLLSFLKFWDIFITLEVFRV